MPNLPNIVQKMIGDNTSLVKASKGSIKALASVGKAGAQLAQATALLGGALGAAAVGGAALLADQSRKSIDETRKLAVNMGTSASEVQALQLSFTQLGISTTDGQRTFQRLTRSLGESELQTKANRKALEALGLTQADVAGKSPIEQFRAVTNALGQMSDANARGQVAAQLFGRQWQHLNVAFQDGGKILDENLRIFGDMKLGLGDAGGEVELMNDQLASLASIGVALRDKVFATLAPKLADLAVAAKDFVLQLIEANGGADNLVKLIVGGLGAGLKSLFEFFGGVAAVGRVVVSVFSTVGKVLAFVGEVGAGVVAVVTSLMRGEIHGALAVGKELVSSGGGAGDDEETNKELRLQTEQLARIAENTFGAVLQ
jgi:hypothetical protein